MLGMSDLFQEASRVWIVTWFVLTGLLITIFNLSLYLIVLPYYYNLIDFLFMNLITLVFWPYLLFILLFAGVQLLASLHYDPFYISLLLIVIDSNLLSFLIIYIVRVSWEHQKRKKGMISA
ncbi:MAG: hypothetical protein ACFFFG_07505 [Candidatus Thorarchaeota archaeon]